MNDKAENQAIDNEVTEPDHVGAEKVRAIIRALSKFIQGKKLYAKNNPTLVKFAKDFDAALQAFFKDEDELVLTIEQYGIKWREQVAYESDRREGNLAFLLYKDGIGEITIESSITFNELEKFVDVLKDEIHSFKTGEDVVTKLWKADFENISYRVLDEYLVGQFGEGKRDEVKKTPLETEDHPDLPSFKDKGRTVVDSDETLESITDYLGDLIDQNHPESSDDEREYRFQDMADSFFMVSNEELRRCRQELAQERKHDSLVVFFDAVVDFTLLIDNPSVARDATNVIESIVDYLVAEGKPAALAGALRAIRNFSASKSMDDKLRSFFESLEEKLTDTTFLSALGAGAAEGMLHPDDVFSYYREVGKRAVPTICALLENLDGPRLHRMACDCLLEVAGDGMPRVIEKLRIDVPRVAQDALYLIEKMTADELPALVQELMYYPDNRVREELVDYLSRVGSGDAINALIRLIDDEDKRIRMKTLSAVKDVESPIIMNKVVAMAFDKDLGKRAFDEQEQVFVTLGRQAGNDIMPQLWNMVEKKSLLPFMRNQNKQNKLLAIRALENIPTPESMGLLETLAEDSDDLVKSRARRAVRVSQEIEPK